MKIIRISKCLWIRNFRHLEKKSASVVFIFLNMSLKRFEDSLFSKIQIAEEAFYPLFTISINYHLKQDSLLSPTCGLITWREHFTVVCSVTWHLNGSEAAGDLVLIQTSMLVLYANRSWREVCIKAWSHPASFALSGQVTKQTTVKWPFIIMRLSIGVSLNFFPNFKAPPTFPYLKRYWNDM